MAVFFSPYEVLSQPLIPDNDSVPYITQGIFVQILNSVGTSDRIYTIAFVGNPCFQASVGAIGLMIEYIDENGKVNQPLVQEFIDNGRKLSLTIPSQGCFIFGAQYILPEAVKLASGGTPQDSAAARGVVVISTDEDDVDLNQILVTTRQYYTKYGTNGQIIGKSAAAYANPLQKG